MNRNKNENKSLHQQKPNNESTSTRGCVGRGVEKESEFYWRLEYVKFAAVLFRYLMKDQRRKSVHTFFESISHPPSLYLSLSLFLPLRRTNAFCLSFGSFFPFPFGENKLIFDGYTENGESQLTQLA